MSEHLVTTVSLTYAYKAKDVLQQRFPSCRVVPTPKSLGNRGCSYSLSLVGNPEEFLPLLSHARIPVLNVL